MGELDDVRMLHCKVLTPVALMHCVRDGDRQESERMMGRGSKVAQAGSKDLPFSTLNCTT